MKGASHDRMPSIIICWEQSKGHAFYEVSHLSSLFLPRHNACRKHVALTECNYQITSAGSCVKAPAAGSGRNFMLRLMCCDPNALVSWEM